MSSHTFLVLCLVALAALSGANAENDRNKRLLSMFQVIRFDNTACEGDNNRNGTCYTKQECEDKDGRDSGSCADGFGVCCTFEIGCGEKTKENCTYFENQNPDPGSCRATVCPISDNICQIRLDFITFQIAGPAVDDRAAGNALHGISSTDGNARGVTQNTQCLTDTFSVSGSGNKPGIICGLNTNEHIYMDADEQCNDLNFNIGQRAVGGASTANRGWNVKITQLQCDHPLLAPDGCTQYHYGPTTGMIRTFNWAGNNVHLADQMQKICIRNEQGMCGVCYTEVNRAADFNLSGGRPIAGGNPVDNAVTADCCGYGPAGAVTNGADCAQFPGAIFNNNQNFAGAMQKVQAVCGRRLGNAAGATSASICQRANPFVVTFKSDSFEFTTSSNTLGAEAGTNTRGFELTYIQGSAGCT